VADLYGDVITTLDEWAAATQRDPKRSYVWICSLCVNQHTLDRVSSSLAATFGPRVEQIGLLLPMVTPWAKPEYFSRLWCIFEFWMAHRHQTEIELLFRPGEATELKGVLEREGGKSVTETMMSGIDCASASASFAEDERWIRHAISHDLGFDTLDLLIRERFERMVLEILDEVMRRHNRANGAHITAALSKLLSEIQTPAGVGVDAPNTLGLEVKRPLPTIGPSPSWR